jgi:hypothetical protein
VTRIPDDAGTLLLANPMRKRIRTTAKRDAERSNRDLIERSNGNLT